MEQATIAQRPLGAKTELPPGSRAPSLLQALRYIRDPLGFLVGLQRRYGDIFTLSFPFFRRIVYGADPALVKTMFTGSPAAPPRAAQGPGARAGPGPPRGRGLRRRAARAAAQAAAAALARRAGPRLR